MSLNLPLLAVVTVYARHHLPFPFLIPVLCPVLCVLDGWLLIKPWSVRSVLQGAATACNRKMCSTWGPN